MAFNFNWSPLTADAEFYSRARDLLTKALNKSPKPPIIVDDILVDELNLGNVPPDLEILEIGDLAEDRFRGIFKMTYSGDAYLTLKTRVQANPLNTYLHSKPSFTSPKPLAAASSLTIPISITLSEIKLSAFIILVFSKQKGLTLVFRNDPLESLKVSSTFDSIQFVRDYLQRTIEQKLRDLMMNELPAIIHRLSLQLWCPDQANKPGEYPADEVDEKGVDPFISPPDDPVDANGNLLDANALSELTLQGAGDAQSLFSQKNLLRLAALTDSHRTLSLFTPGIRDVVFRAWTGHGDRSEAMTPAMAPPSLSRTHSLPTGTSTTYTFSDTSSTTQGYLPSRSASQINLNSTSPGRAVGTSSRSRPGRKKKTRVVNLRRSKSQVDSPIETETESETGSDTISEGPFSEPLMTSSIPEMEDEEDSLVKSLASKLHFTNEEKKSAAPINQSPLSQPPLVPGPSEQTSAIAKALEDASKKLSVDTGLPKRTQTKHDSGSDSSSVILEQAWIMKMAGEIARRVYDEKNRQNNDNNNNPSGGVWEEQEAPPTYEAAIH
ncbi:unnamed protein product [Clonostachys chloroleuca]|uniref:Mitochondrial distribution and morphology protein 34 n=1 Tax=Clonostachys chloroleuca TaxID=1926264 RepID=A0AA35M1N0_9HYPO|nr:unnamed protein product [Clonostachys chloroleuca]